MDSPNQALKPTTKVALVPRQSPAPLSNRIDYPAENPYGFDSPQDADPGQGIFDYWRILTRNKRTIFLASLVGLGLGIAVCIPMKPVYRAQTSLEVLAMNQDFLNLKQTSPTVSDGSVDTSEASTQAKLLQSATLTKRVFAKLLPISAPTKPKSSLSSSGWRAIFHLPNRTPLTPREILLSKASASLKVKETAHTRVLEITVDSPDPQLAADYANTLTQEFIAQNAEDRWQSTQNTSGWLRRELDEARDRLRKSEDALQAYARDSGIILTDESTNVATEKLQQLQQELSAAAADRIAKQSRFELAQNSPPDSLADVLNDTALRETQSKVYDLNRQIADLGTVYNPEYSKVRRLQAELESLQTALTRQRTEIINRIGTDYREAQRKESLLADAYQTQTGEVTGQGEKTIQYSILKREVDSNRQLYDTMLQQMKQSSIAAALRASNVRIVDAAEVPDIPVSPNFRIASAVGLLAGMLFSSIAVLIHHQLDRTLQQPGEIKLWADLPELGAIPNSNIKVRNKALASNSKTTSEQVVVWQNSFSLLAEAFRSALSSIIFTSEDGACPRILLFTSPDAADGKTTVVSNIALAAAEIRLKVLIIDADLRRPRMHELFNLTNEFGLAELLQSDLTSENLSKSIRPTHMANLHVVTAGQTTQAAAHLLYSPNLKALLALFAKEYDMVLIDTPPMLQMTDARIVARHANAVVLVARAGITTRDALLAAKQRLQEDRTPVLGSMLNNWDPRHSKTSYYNSYTRAAS